MYLQKKKLKALAYLVKISHSNKSWITCTQGLKIKISLKHGGLKNTGVNKFSSLTNRQQFQKWANYYITLVLKSIMFSPQ